MKIWHAAVLGIVQGLTEFLPVSSSGHLVLLSRLFGLEVDTFINLVFHLGTLVAVVAIFWKDILALFKKPFKTLGFLVLASIPAAIVGFLLEDKIDELFNNGKYSGIILACLFLVTATVLISTEIFVKRRQTSLPLCMRTVIPMGLAQAVAVLPGISRSGSTICAGTLAGGKGEEVAKFSFLMSIPVILGGFVVSVVKIIIDRNELPVIENGVTFGVGMALGFVVSAAVGLFAIKVMLKAISKANYKWFAIYLILLAITCAVLFFVKVI